ncbi:suppressor APC domain-containing protein 2-like [Carcharodon carcharias]|uniref:suppressor APC domain-containing protein 2-like n=1 Tax=Carcharodon carcharias TaxID=13397 RepID=UPI001B7DD103|nr:suppressor APC domain-containing protein 2-like [Carcharodon carcharias]
MSRPELPQPQPRERERCLPRAFLLSLRTLFDILDQEGRGSVDLREIESRWRGEGSREPALPPGLMPCLRRVAAPSGQLTFPRLLAGIRTALQQETESPGPGGGQEQRPALGTSQHRDPAGKGAERLATDNRTWAKDHEGTGISRSQSIATSIARGALHRSCQGRNEPRRHTIANGIDYDMLKQMKELERERDALLHGLEVVERARDWYHQQIHAVHQRQKHVRQGYGNKDYFTDPHQNRAYLLLAKIQEVNCCLSDLISSSGKLPFVHHHTNGFGSPLKVMGFQRQPISSLKEQNHLLTKELSMKSERITILEQEKTSLIKQLIEAREQGHLNASSKDPSIT